MGGKGLIDLLVFKRAIASYLADTWIIQHGFDAKSAANIKDFAVGHASYRKKVGFPSDHEADLSWIATLPLSVQLVFRFFEAPACHCASACADGRARGGWGRGCLGTRSRHAWGF